MKVIITTLSLIFFSLLLQAQSPFGAAVVLGGNITQLTGDDDPGFNKLGLHAGIKGIVNINYRSEAAIGIVFDQRGSRNTPRGQNANNPFRIEMDYVTVPLTYTFKDWFNEEDAFYKIHFTGGITYGRLFRSAQEGEQVDPTCFENLPENDFSWNLGASYFITEHIGISVFHLRSLATLKPESPNGPCRFLFPYQWTARAEYVF